MLDEQDAEHMFYLLFPHAIKHKSREATLRHDAVNEPVPLTK